MASKMESLETEITKRSEQCKNDCHTVVVKAHEIIIHPVSEFQIGMSRGENEKF